MAVDNDFIRKNPCRVKVGDVLRDNTREREPLSDADLIHLLTFMESHTCYRKYVDLVIILVTTGLRISELCALTISDIDFRKRHIRVTKQMQYDSSAGFYFSQPKTAKGVRTIPIENERLLEALRRAVDKAASREVQCTVDDSSPILFCTTHNNPFPATTMDGQFERIAKAYQKANPDSSTRITPHVLRHTFCSNLINNNANVKSVQYLMGHNSASVTLDVYSHANQDTIRSAIRKLIPPGSDTKIDTKREGTDNKL